ncbi:MAG: YdcF family protein [Proteobacteria bacterium]|nr:YdcF family protein [Pseudomonadota bacterium]
MKLLQRLLALVGALTLVSLLAGGTVMYFAGEWMQVHDEPVQADYILPLAGDANRWIYAADLYKQGFAPVILVSKPAPAPPSALSPIHKAMGYPQYDLMEYARRLYGVLDVPEAALQMFGDGHLSTVEEAEALRDFLGPGKHRLLVVTSPYHARRAKLVLSLVLPDAEIRMTVTPYEYFDPQWWTDYYTAPKVVLEAAKCTYYLLGGVFRSSD